MISVGTLNSLAGPIGKLNHQMPNTNTRPARNFPNQTGTKSDIAHTSGPQANSENKMIITKTANDSMLYLCSM